MTRLLVSVRSLDEALDAFEAGADIIDLKEPSAGSLGRVPQAVAEEVAARLAQSIQLSMAMGELQNARNSIVPAHGDELPEAIAFAKLGLAGCASDGQWPRHWAAAVRRLPASCAPVAVVYADWQAAEAPPPADVLHWAAKFGCRALLIDTCNKKQGNVFDHLPMPQAAELLAEARSRQLLTVLAGSLTLESATDALNCGPDYLAVRGAVCGGSRQARLMPDKVRVWKDLCRLRSTSNIDGF
ncbi:MAG TPA: (5-formylfuran-3-yl)methyl phosphate synthase [Pirellulales bacterium]|nr:(5-formylfuran-3-yl)methyl phosphate synthase [Pirellulales bacterium]